MSQDGTKLDLAARALVAYEKNEPVRKDIKSLEDELKDTYNKLLRDDDIQDPNSISNEDWIDDVSLWPRIDLGKVFSYIINKKAFETEYIGQYKAKKAYSYFMSGFVHEIVAYCPSQDKIILKGNVTPSQKIREKPRNVWVLCSKSGEVICANCTCTAGFGECCNHVVAILYKVEYANSHGLIDPACTAVACAWNKSTEREVEPQKVKDLVLKKHDSLNRTKKHLVQSEYKTNFDVRPKELRGMEHERLEEFYSKLRAVRPTAVALACIQPPFDFACPPSMTEIADKILIEHTGQSEQFLIGALMDAMSFNEPQLKELEKSTRAQAGSALWKQQRIGCITGTKIRDVSTKTAKLVRVGKNTRPKVSPLLARLFRNFDIGSLPAVKYGREHEEDARRAFCEAVAKKHRNGKVLESGLVASRTFPFVRATPDNVFTCTCCEENRVPVEYKCPYKIRSKTVQDGAMELDFLEVGPQGQISLKKAHKYYSQVTTQIALVGAQFGYFVVWTPIGEAFVQQVAFDKEHWAELERNAVVFFKTHVSRVLLKQRDICYCPTCDKVCCEPEELEENEVAEYSVQCSQCDLWYHWHCVNLKRNPKNDWICEGCIQLALAPTQDDIFAL